MAFVSNPLRRNHPKIDRTNEAFEKQTFARGSVFMLMLSHAKAYSTPELLLMDGGR